MPFCYAEKKKPSNPNGQICSFLLWQCFCYTSARVYLVFCVYIAGIPLLYLLYYYFKSKSCLFLCLCVEGLNFPNCLIWWLESKPNTSNNNKLVKKREWSLFGTWSKLPQMLLGRFICSTSDAVRASLIGLLFPFGVMEQLSVNADGYVLSTCVFLLY